MKEEEKLDKSLKFDKETAESIGVESAIILNWIQNKGKEETINLSEAFEELSFWSETDLMSYLISLEQKNLIGLDLDKKTISKTTNRKKKNSIQMNKVHEKSKINNTWRPSEDVMEILTRAGINSEFLEGLIPEFVIYWSERADVLIPYNSKFIEHARLKWAQHSAEIETKKNPSIMTDEWQPSQDCIDIVQMTGIDNNFVEESLPAFKLYWKDDGRSSVSWDSKFIDFIKKRASFFNQQSGNQNKQAFNWYNPYEEEKDKKLSNKKTVEKLRKKHKV